MKILKWLSVSTLLLLQHENGVSVVSGYRPERHGGIFELIAQYPDGKPAKGTIACDGFWFKHADEAVDEGEAEWAERMPFQTDSRGATFFNPNYFDEDSLTCYAETKAGRHGSITFVPEDGKTYIIPVQ